MSAHSFLFHRITWLGPVLTLIMYSVFLNTEVRAQNSTVPFFQKVADPCGDPDRTSLSYQRSAREQWGYGYDSLKSDLNRWALSPFVHIDSVGASVQNRGLFMLTIQDTTNIPFRKRIWIHARTHPGEVQGTRVTNEIISYLLSESPTAVLLRDSCVFNILPMLNPDGVELGYGRENANGIDLESNWSANPPQVEVQVLRSLFAALMSLPNPITVALNMHSSYNCKRFFVYHDASGTSLLLAVMQQKFIGSVRSNYLNGIEPYNYFISWTSSPPPAYYPESWFWYNYHENVLANTYEDMNCSSAGAFDTTAVAIVRGIQDYLHLAPTIVQEPSFVPAQFKLYQNYPNPFNPRTTIRYELPSSSYVTLRVYNLLGKEIATVVDERQEAGCRSVMFDAASASGSLPSGVYFYRLQAGKYIEVKKFLLVK